MVVVVTVLVSTHCATSYCSLAARPATSESSGSSKLTVSRWLVRGRRISVVFWTGGEPLGGGTVDMPEGTTRWWWGVVGCNQGMIKMAIQKCDGG